MPLDPSIFGQIQQPQQVNPLAQLAQVSQIQGAQQQNRLAQLQMQEYERARQQDEARRMAIQGAGTDPQRIGAALLGVGDLAGYNANNKALAEQGKLANEADALKFKTLHDKSTALLNVVSAARDPASYQQALQTAQSMGVDVSTAPQQYDPAYVASALQQAQTATQRIEAEAKSRGLDIQALTQQEQGRHNRAGEGLTARGQNMTDSRAREGLNLQREASRTQVVDTENGPVLVDKGTGQARQVTAPDGVSLRKPGREVPAAANKSILENKQNISKIDEAIAAIEARPGSVGPVNMIPGAETVRQFTDPKGVLARAGVADVGSLILHDRSGAAVTASETPRLRPFIPSASDRPEVAVEKLKRFRQMYEQEASLLADSYGSQQGYRNSTASPAVAPKGPSVGSIQGGYKFKGGDPAVASNWEKQ